MALSLEASGGAVALCAIEITTAEEAPPPPGFARALSQKLSDGLGRLLLPLAVRCTPHAI